jgi:hypothetical protein
MTTKTLIPSLNIKGLNVTEETHEKYGVTKQIKLAGKTGKYPSVNVEVDGKLHKMSIGSLKTETLDGNGDAVWVPVLRLQEIAASIPKAVSTSVMPKVSAADKQDFADFLAFKAMKAAAAK